MVQVLNVSLTADGSTWDFESISVSVKFISAMYCTRLVYVRVLYQFSFLLN